MSMNYQSPGSDKSITEEEGVMFAATPVWDRNRKRKGGFGRKAAPAAAASTVAPEPRSFVERDDLALDAPVQRPIPDAYVRTDPVTARPAASAETDGGMVAAIGRPTARTTRSAKSSSVAPVALAAGIVALGAIAGVGWYATQGDDGIPEIAPGGQTEMAAAPLPPVVTTPESPADAAMAVNPPSAAAPPRTTVPSAAPVRQAQARSRPAAAAAPSAGDTGVNASATTLPTGPQPYSTLNPGATPPMVVIPPAVAPTAPTTPTQAAPAPTEAPAAIPETPPTIPQTAPTEEPLTETPPTAS